MNEIVYYAKVDGFDDDSVIRIEKREGLHPEIIICSPSSIEKVIDIYDKRGIVILPITEFKL